MFWNFRRPKSIAVTNLNDLYLSSINEVRHALGKKVNHKSRSRYGSKKLYVLEFNGDIMATQVENLKFEITSILCSASEHDEVLVKVNSPGGAAHVYGYAASQLKRIKDAEIPLTIAVDKVAASGGYMMACVADKIIAAPFAIVGSIGVVAELPNVYNLLQTLGVDYKQYTAGKFKRTVSMMGEITEEGEEKFKEDLKTTYDLFCDHVKSNRDVVDIEKVATGEHWQAIKAIDLNLVDEILTSEEYICTRINEGVEVLQLSYVGNRAGFLEKLGIGLFDKVLNLIISKIMYLNFR